MPKSMRGFASMPPEKRRAIASRGGFVAHKRGVAHRWTSEEASKAGIIGSRTMKRKRHRRVDNATAVHWIRTATLEAESIQLARQRQAIPHQQSDH